MSRLREFVRLVTLAPSASTCVWTDWSCKGTETVLERRIVALGGECVGSGVGTGVAESESASDRVDFRASTAAQAILAALSSDRASLRLSMKAMDENTSKITY